MFDIGFSEIVVIAVVALIVIGPEKLPKTARTLGHLFGRLQRYVSDVKADINREMELDELRKLQTQVQSAAREVETSFDSATREMETGVRNVEQQLSDEPGGAAVPAAGTASRCPSTAPAARRPRRSCGGASCRRAVGPRRTPRGRHRCPDSTAADARGPPPMSDPSPAPESPQESFISHLVELRTRLVRSVFAILIVLFALFPWAKDIYALLAAPLLQRAAAGLDDDRDRRHRHVPGPAQGDAGWRRS